MDRGYRPSSRDDLLRLGPYRMEPLVNAFFLVPTRFSFSPNLVFVGAVASIVGAILILALWMRWKP